MPVSWHLRSSATASNAGGREYPSGTRVVLLEHVSSVTRGSAERFFRVRVVSDGATGFAFVPVSALPACAPGGSSGSSGSSGSWWDRNKGVVGWGASVLALLGVVGAGWRYREPLRGAASKAGGALRRLPVPSLPVWSKRGSARPVESARPVVVEHGEGGPVISTGGKRFRRVG